MWHADVEQAETVMQFDATNKNLFPEWQREIFTDQKLKLAANLMPSLTRSFLFFSFSLGATSLHTKS